jgi:hypothetical protein
MMTRLIIEALIASNTVVPPPITRHVSRLNFVTPHNFMTTPTVSKKQASKSRIVWFVMKMLTVPLLDFFELNNTANTTAFATNPRTPMNF